LRRRTSKQSRLAGAGAVECGSGLRALEQVTKIKTPAGGWGRRGAV